MPATRRAPQLPDGSRRLLDALLRATHKALHRRLRAAAAAAPRRARVDRRHAASPRELRQERQQACGVARDLRPADAHACRGARAERAPPASAPLQESQRLPTREWPRAATRARVNAPLNRQERRPPPYARAARTARAVAGAAGARAGLDG
jgi:hypothetical protein